MDLAEFLLARIVEDEATNDRLVRDEVARCRADGIPNMTEGDVRAFWGEQGWWKRRLAECEAKRRIVEMYRQERDLRDAYQSEDARAGEDEEQATRRRSSAARCRGLEISVELLALPYASHSDYREVWTP